MIKIEIKEEDAYKIALFLGIQDIDDTRHIIEKYDANMNDYEVEEAVQNLFDKLSCELGLEM